MGSNMAGLSPPHQRLLSQSPPDQYCVAMSAIDPLPDAGEEAARGAGLVSTKRGKWSVFLALGSVAVFLVGNLVFFFLLPMFGTILEPGFQAAARVNTFIVLVIMSGMLIAAVVLGVASIVGAWRQRGRPGRTSAIGLGCVGIVLSALIGFYLLLPFLPI